MGGAHDSHHLTAGIAGCTRRRGGGIAEWLVERLSEGVPMLVGIDHGFSFPLRYFQVHGLKPDWLIFLDDFQHHWPTDNDHNYVDFVREGVMGNGAARMGNAHWRRIHPGAATCRARWRNPPMPDSLASLHAPAPWRLRSFLAVRRLGRPHRALGHRRGLSVALAPQLQAKAERPISMTLSASPPGCRAPTTPGLLSPAERAVALVEGWILGVPGLARSDDRSKRCLGLRKTTGSSLHHGGNCGGACHEVICS